MKTTDLIPIILYQLNDGDRYGYEIIKQIEDCSAGKIIIKQPTLYSVLKKLEQSKFITSYWQDSEIGGKRHYYKLTDNGISQLSTYPALQQLIADALDEDIIQPTGTNSEPISSISTDILEEAIQPSSPILTVDEYSTNVLNPIKIDLTSPTGFATQTENENFNLEEANEEPVETSISNNSSIFDAIEPAADIENSSSDVNIFDVMEPAVNVETITSPVSIFDAIDADEIKSTEPAVIEDVNLTVEYATPNYTAEPNTHSIQAKEVEDIVTVVPEVEPIELKSKLVDKLDTNADAFITAENSNVEEITDSYENYSPIEQIRYLNYVDLSTDEKACTRRKVISKHIQKMALTCSTLLLMFVLTLVACSKYSFGKIYYVCAIISVFTIILYPIILLKDVSKLRLKYCTHPFRYSLFQDMFIKLSTFLSLVIVIFAYNISTTSSISNMFKLSNFASLYAPIIFASIFVFDLLFSILLYKNYRVKK